MVRLLRNFKLIAQIDAADVFIFDHIGGGSGHQNTSLVQDVSAVYNLKRFADIVVGDQHANPSLFEVGDKRPDIIYRYRIDTRKGFIEQKVSGTGRQTAGNLDTPPFTA